jgi:hypothetical protein
LSIKEGIKIHVKSKFAKSDASISLAEKSAGHGGFTLAAPPAAAERGASVFTKLAPPPEFAPAVPTIAPTKVAVAEEDCDAEFGEFEG